MPRSSCQAAFFATISGLSWQRTQEFAQEIALVLMENLVKLSMSLALLALAALLSGGRSSAQDQDDQTPRNSTRKVRVKPSPISAKIGSGVHWEIDLDTAIKRSAETGKPVFWYVPTLSDSFMDRKPEIDRYMMAGPFSWEATRSQLNAHYIPVKAVPTAEQQKRYDLVPYTFVEPGFLILKADGSEKFKVDRITTLHKPWFEALLTHANASAAESPDPQPNSAVTNLVTQKIETRMKQATDVFHKGDHRQAATIWKSIADEYPEHPLGWKAAAEAEGFGPIVRGFEVDSEIPVAVLKAGIDSAGSAAPKGVYKKEDVTKRSIEFLLDMQRSDGAWVDCDYDFGGTDSLPNVHVAVTSLAGMALLASKHALPEKATAIESAIVRAADFVRDDSHLNKFDRDEILWAYAYRVRFLSRLVVDRPELKPSLQHGVELLEQIQTKRGGWYHEYANPFVTATALVALAEAKQAGATIDQEKIDLGIASLERDRFENGAYPYGSSRRAANAGKAGKPRQVAASAGRMPLCELGLWSWQKASDENLDAAIQISFDMHEHLNTALKYDDHTSNMAYGGFFFWYDMRGRSEAISKITNKSLRQKYERQQQEIIMSLPELDGCFVDSHELGRCYGTAMALLCLQQMLDQK